MQPDHLTEALLLVSSIHKLCRDILALVEEISSAVRHTEDDPDWVDSNEDGSLTEEDEYLDEEGFIPQTVREAL